MKNLILTLTAGLFLLTGCSKDESFEQMEEQTIDSIYILNQIDGMTTIETTSIDLQTGTDFTYTTDNGNGNGQTTGAYISMNRNANTISWSGFTDETGSYGNAEVLLSSPGYSLRLQMVTECVTVDGNEAVYGGIVTQVLDSSGNPPPFTVNWRFYFKVIDTEQSGGISYDLISNTRIFASPMSPSLCNTYLPDNRIWSSQGHENVRQPGFVEVTDHPQ